MDWNQVIVNLASVVVPIGGLIGWCWSRLDKRLEKMEENIKEIEKDIRSIDVRLSKLEGQDEERFRNEIRLIAKGGI